MIKLLNCNIATVQVNRTTNVKKITYFLTTKIGQNLGQRMATKTPFT